MSCRKLVLQQSNWTRNKDMLTGSNM